MLVPPEGLKGYTSAVVDPGGGSGWGGGGRIRPLSPESCWVFTTCLTKELLQRCDGKLKMKCSKFTCF